MLCAQEDLAREQLESWMAKVRVNTLLDFSCAFCAELVREISSRACVFIGNN